MERREFIKGAVATAVALPLWGGEERRKISFLHITDTHLDMGEPESVEALKLMVRSINFKYPDLDFVLFGGDNFNNNGRGASDALLFKEIISGLSMPAYSVRGNKEASPTGDPQIDGEEFIELFRTDDMLTVNRDWAVIHKGYLILGLDSPIDHHNNGRFSQETLAFAKKMLDFGKPTIILDHHPYLNFWGSRDPENIKKYVLNNTDQVQRELFTYPNLLLTLSGHIHVDDTESRIGHVWTITTRAFKNALAPDRYPMRLVTIEGRKISQKLVHT
ncbi:MAG: hypothetical protein GXO19_05100 [Epsilonproteobacteria bacterium]|nr:hypothetical protein [Campylobacterota bacterium]NPA57095.1 hypothetical protein [Campylobacterota bacterium]